MIPIPPHTRTEELLELENDLVREIGIVPVKLEGLGYSLFRLGVVKVSEPATGHFFFGACYFLTSRTSSKVYVLASALISSSCSSSTPNWSRVLSTRSRATSAVVICTTS